MHGVGRRPLFYDTQQKKKIMLLARCGFCCFLLQMTCIYMYMWFFLKIIVGW